MKNGVVRSAADGCCVQEQIAVIGKKASRVSKDDAYDYIAGWMVGNDVSERILQLTKNKSPR